jgi:hypothetical protein
MIPKTWLQQDYILIGFTRGAFIVLILAILLYTLLWYKLGEWKASGALKRFWWRWFWWTSELRGWRLRRCGRCGGVVRREKKLDYPYYCPRCDENLFEFETCFRKR